MVKEGPLVRQVPWGTLHDLVPPFYLKQSPGPVLYQHLTVQTAVLVLFYIHVATFLLCGFHLLVKPLIPSHVSYNHDGVFWWIEMNHDLLREKCHVYSTLKRNSVYGNLWIRAREWFFLGGGEIFIHDTPINQKTFLKYLVLRKTISVKSLHADFCWYTSWNYG